MKRFSYARGYAYGRLLRFLLHHVAPIGVPLLRRKLHLLFTSYSEYGDLVFGLAGGDAERWAANKIRAAFAGGSPATQALIEVLIAPWFDDAAVA